MEVLLEIGLGKLRRPVPRSKKIANLLCKRKSFSQDSAVCVLNGRAGERNLL